MTIKMAEELAGQFQKMRLSAEYYQQMGAAGIFEDKPRVELIDGEIYTMSPFTPKHAAQVDKLSRFFNRMLFDYVLVRTQGAIRMDDFSEPKPDIAILRFQEDFYQYEQATSKDTLLVIEVAVSTLEKDRTLKLNKYASVEIPEYWIIIPAKEIIEVYRKPEDGVYLEKNTYRKTDSWTFETFDLTLNGSDLLI